MSLQFGDDVSLVVTKPGQVYEIPKKLSAVLVAKIKDGLLAGLDLNKACRRAGVSSVTVRKWMSLGDLARLEPSVLPEPMQREGEDDLTYHGRRGAFVQGRDLLLTLSEVLLSAEVESEYKALARMQRAAEGDWRADQAFLKLTKPADYNSVVNYRVDGLEELVMLCKQTGIPIELVIQEAIAAIKGTMTLDELTRGEHDERFETDDDNVIEAEYSEA